MYFNLRLKQFMWRNLYFVYVKNIYFHFRKYKFCACLENKKTILASQSYNNVSQTPLTWFIQINFNAQSTEADSVKKNYVCAENIDFYLNQNILGK